MALNRKLINLFGSLKLAVVLLTALAVAMAVATFYESETSSQSALINVYRSWWFNGLLLLLAINVAAAALSRWPWQKRHVGFVITHIGLIVLLGGCSAAFHYGTEGMLELRVGQPPANVVRLQEEVVTAVLPPGGAPVKRRVRPQLDGGVTPRAIALGPDVRLTLDEYVPNTTVKTSIEPAAEDAAAGPALEYRLRSEMARQDLTDWLVAAEPTMNRAALGPVTVRLVTATDAADLARLLAPPDPQADARPVVVINMDGHTYRLDVGTNLDKHVSLGGGGPAAHVVGYWPDFTMDENHKPSTASNEPRNPAALVLITRGDAEQRYFLFASGEIGPIVKTVRGQPFEATVQLTAGAAGPLGSGLTVIWGPENQLHFAAQSKTGFTNGVLAVGQELQPGWMDFGFTVMKVVPRARVTGKLEKAPIDPEGGAPALVLTAHAGGKQETQWVRLGQATLFQSLPQPVHAIYTWDTMELPFTVELEDFAVERDEGSMNVAGWTSKVAFSDAKRGLRQQAAVWMNHPASFQGYKFSQSSWNPNDLKYTVLQVKKDPDFVTWLTWAGSGLIIAGTALMFWGRGWLMKRAPRPA